MLTSVGSEKTEFLKVDMTDNVYLVMEVMSGELEISHAIGTVRQSRYLHIMLAYTCHFQDNLEIDKVGFKM